MVSLEYKYSKPMKGKKTAQTVLLPKGYLCSCDVQEESRFLKEDTHFHHELGECDREYAQETGTFHKLCDHHHTIF